MIPLLIVLAEVSQSSGTSTPTSSILLYIFGSVIAGGGLTMLAGAIRRARQGNMEDQELVSRITRDTLSGAKDILAEYRLEVEVVKRQVEDYRQQLNKLTQALADANLRIANLEKDLQSAHTMRQTLHQDLEEAVSERKRLMVEITRLHEQINRLLGMENPEDDDKTVS